MPIYHVVFRGPNGSVEVKEYTDLKSLLRDYEQIGVEEDSYSMRLHGEPVLKGLVGPMSEGKSIVRYETAEVYPELTEVWSKTKRPRKKST